jgi:putative FmdB family regulatory protein
MPTYEYECPEGHTFEKFQKMTDKARTKCPACGKPATRKISGGAGLVFRGSGFYITDYGKDGKGPRKDGAEGGSDSSSSEKPSDKPAGTPTEKTAPAASGTDAAVPAKPTEKKKAKPGSAE